MLQGRGSIGALSIYPTILLTLSALPSLDNQGLERIAFYPSEGGSEAEATFH